jgi:hypothetical protein
MQGGTPTGRPLACSSGAGAGAGAGAVPADDVGTGVIAKPRLIVTLPVIRRLAQPPRWARTVFLPPPASLARGHALAVAARCHWQAPRASSGQPFQAITQSGELAGAREPAVALPTLRCGR